MRWQKPRAIERERHVAGRGRRLHRDVERCDLEIGLLDPRAADEKIECRDRPLGDGHALDDQRIPCRVRQDQRVSCLHVIHVVEDRGVRPGAAASEDRSGKRAVGKIRERAAELVELNQILRVFVEDELDQSHDAALMIGQPVGAGTACGAACEQHLAIEQAPRTVLVLLDVGAVIEFVRQLTRDEVRRNSFFVGTRHLHDQGHWSHLSGSPWRNGQPRRASSRGDCIGFSGSLCMLSRSRAFAIAAIAAFSRPSAWS